MAIGDKKAVPVSLRLRPSLGAQLAGEARRQRRSLSNLLETILEDYVETRLLEERLSWDAFWETLHAETGERGLDRISPEEIVAEVHRSRAKSNSVHPRSR